MKGVNFIESKNKFKVSHPLGNNKYLQTYYEEELLANQTKILLCLSDGITPNTKLQKSRGAVHDLPIGLRQSIHRGKNIITSTIKDVYDINQYKTVTFSNEAEKIIAANTVEKWRKDIIKSDLIFLAKQYDLDINLKLLDK
jgi:hypothetical protein